MLLSITLGKNGSIFVKSPTEKFMCPSYYRNVLDTGAGDSILLSVVCLCKWMPQYTNTFISNLYAGLNTRHLANRSAISLIDLERALKGLILRTKNFQNTLISI